METIDLRSDTVTRPTPAMKQAMMEAEVGDDVYGEDPSVNRLETETAELFGKEAGLFCPSGTMTNQIAIKVHTQPGDELICAENAHVYKYEGGGVAFNSGVQVKQLAGNRGRLDAVQVAEAINPDDVHFPVTKLVCLENTSNRGGGSVYELDTITRIAEVCRQHHMILHLDGARVFNAMVAKGYTAREIGAPFDSVSVCLSKGLGAPVGSLLLGSQAFIAKAKRIRKVFGGGMRQAGFLAAAGSYALEYHISRLADDHARAQAVTEVLSTIPAVKMIMPVETNIIIFQLESVAVTDTFHAYLKQHGILCGRIAPDTLRMVFHLDITGEMMSRLLDITSRITMV
jgi:threonine aldolase